MSVALLRRRPAWDATHLADDETSATTRFERVVLPHLDAAYTLARYLTRETADADDAVQETVLRALRYLPSLKRDSDARAWLLAIVRRECRDVRGARQTQADSVSFDDAPALELVDVRTSPDDAAHRQLVRDYISAAVGRLSPRLRETLILREVQQCSYDEIARITGVPIGTVMSRLSRARARVAEQLRGVVDPGDLS